jgi:hypothetical protein
VKQGNNPAALKMAPTCLSTLLCKNLVAIWLQGKSEIREESASLSLPLTHSLSLNRTRQEGRTALSASYQCLKEKEKANSRSSAQVSIESMMERENIARMK